MFAKFLSRAAAAALLLAAMSVAASAQVVQATGKVTLKQADGTEAPVQNALIKFYRTDIKQTFEAKTGKNGTYVHAGIPLVGTFTIAVSAPGARPSYIPDIPIGRKRAEAEAAERKRIEEQNAKAMELNTKLPEILKSGNDAFTAKNYDQAITL